MRAPRLAAGARLAMAAGIFAVSAVAGALGSAVAAGSSTGGYAAPLEFNAGASTGGAHRRMDHFDPASAVDMLGAVARRWFEEYVDRSSPAAISDIFPSEDGGGGTVSLRRALSHGHFAALNDMLYGMVVKLPDAFIEQDMPLGKIDLYITNIRCFDIRVHDVIISYEMQGDYKKLNFNVDMNGLDLDCDAVWQYFYGWSESGTLEFRSDDNAAATTIGFTSQDFRKHPPNGSNVDKCSPTINISHIKISGGVAGTIAGLFEKLLRGPVATAIRDVVCKELGGLGSTAVSDLLEYVSEVVDGYLVDLPADLADPLHAEKTLDVPSDVRLLDLTNVGGEGSDVESWFDAALEKVDDLLAKEVDDPSSPKSNKKDLGVNKMLRSSLLDEERAYVVPVSDWPESLLDGGVLMRSHDVLTETTIQLTKVRIMGLDTFTSFDPLNIIGKYTISNKFSWEHISFVLDLKITMKPSTSSDSIIVSPGTKETVEQIQISSGVNNVRAALSFMLALDLNALGEIELGSVMHLGRILPCLLSAFFAVELTELDVQVDDIQTPSIDGFISVGIDKVLKTSSMAVFEMFEASLLKAVPGFFQMTVRQMANDMAKSYMSDSSNVDCPTYSGTANDDATVDFRDFFLAPEKAKALGAKGTSPYGDIGSTLMSLLNDQLLSTDDDGSLKLNSMLIAPLTEAQSGTAGTLSFPSALFTLIKDRVPDVVWRAFATRMELSGSNARVRNLDTLDPPVSVLFPSSVNPRMLMNNVNFNEEGPSASSPRRPLGGAVQILLDIDDENSPLFMKNEVDVSVDIGQTSFFADILASVSERRLMEFPLKHVMNRHCWLATMPPPRLDENGLRFGDEDAGISISELAILLWSTEIDMKCVDCSSSGMSKVSQVLADYKEIGTVNKIKERLVGVAVELLKSPWLQAQIDTMLVDAPRQCPFHPSYDADFVPATIDVSGDASPVSRDTVELIAFAGAAAVGVVGVAGAESHLAFDPEPTDPMSAESALLVPEGTNLLSFGDFDGYVDMALDDLRAALGSNVEDSTGPNANSTGEDLLINVLLRNELLDEDRALEIPVNKSLQEAGFMVGLESVRIFGLDTFSSFDVLDIIGNYTFTNTFSLDNVAVELDVVLDMSPPEQSQDRRSLESGTLEHMLFRLSMREIDVTAAVFLAIDEDRLFDLPLGSILRANQVVGCLLSSTFGAEVTDLSATMGDIDEPTFTGFVSDELNTEISEAMEMIRQKYRSMMLDSVPALFGVTLRKILNNIADSYLSEDTSKYCPPPVVPPEAPGVVDFRDLILSPTEAAAAGGGGDSPYGDLAAKLINIIDERLLSSLSEDGTPKINEAVIRPFTLEQSGTEGQFNFEDDLANFASQVDFAGIGGIDFRASNATISNLDTFGHPLELLRPDTTFPYVLDNKANMGVGPEPLSGSLRVLMEVTGDPKLSMSNELLLGMNVRSANIFASILAKMSEKDFLHFPIGDVMLPQCWLASILTPVLDSVGLRDGTLEPSLALEEFALAIASLRFNVSCVACSTEGLVELPGIIGVLEEAGTVSEWTSRLVDFIVDILQSNLVTVQIDRVLADAPKQCPHSPEYDESFLPTEYDAIGSFDLSRDSVEFVVYSGLVVFESIAVVVAKTHTSYETQVQDPLSGQKLLEAPTDVRLLDLEDLGASVGSWADSILDEASGFFAGRVEDANSPSGEDLAVNVFLRDWLLDKEGVLVLDIDDLGIEAGGFTVSFQSVRILGLDTFTSFDALQVIGSQTLLNNFSMKKLGVEVSVAIDMEPDSPGDAEVMTFGVTMTDIEATIAFLVALDLDRLGSLPLGSILRIEQILPCVLSSMHAVNLTQFSVSVGDISEPDIHGFISPDTKNAIEEVSRAIFGTYKSDLIEGVPNFFDVTVRALLNNLLHEYMDKESSVSCPSLLSSGESTVLDMRDLFLPESDAFDLGAAGNSPYGDLFRSLKSLVDEEVLAVDPVTGLSKANDMVIGPLTKKQSNVTGMLHYQNDLIGGKKRLVVGGFKADAEFRLSNIRIEHLDTVGNPLELLQPIQSNPHVLNNTAAVGVANEPLRLTMSVLFSLQADDGTRMHNELDLGVDLETAMVVLGALIKISEGSFFSFPLRDLTNFNCWLATIDAPALDSYGVRVSGADPTLALQHLSASIQRLQLRVDCIDCSSPALRDISELLSSPQAIKDATDTANRVLDYGTGLLGGKFLQIKIDRMLRDAVAKCPHKEGFDSDFDGYTYQAFESPQMEESSLSFFIAMAIVAVVIFILAAIAYFVVKWVVWRRHRRWLKTKTEEEIFHIHMSQMQEENQEKELCRRTSSMCSSKVIPLALRVLMPLIILGNIAFFLSGHLSKGASVSIRLHLGGQDLIIEDFFVFSIARSTVDMWKAGAKELAMLILIFSGIWPYTKQLVTLVLWFMPPSRVSVSKRGSIFLWLDILGKWSMIDIFVLLVCLAAFRVSISSPELGFLPEGLYSLDLTVIPLWGLYANMTAQLISQVSSHFIIYYHRKIVDTAAEERDGSMSRSIEDIKDCDASSETSKGEEYASFAHEEEPSEHKEALFRHRFVLTYNKEGRHAIVRRWVNHVPPAVAIVILALIIWGCTWTSFSLEVHGLVGLAVESGQGFQQAKRQYNLFSLAKALMDQARFLDVGKWYLGLGILASLLVITVLIVPLFQVAVLLWIWFAKLTDRKRKFAMATVEVLQAWQYVEVYILSIIVGAWQIGGVSGFMVNEYCDALEEMFAEYAYYGIISESDAQCFRVDATLEGACFVLLVAAILLGFLNNFIMKALNQHIHDLDSAGKIEVLSIKEGTTFANEDVGTSSRAAKIKPLSPRFTDSYRWFTVVDKPFEPFCSNPSKLNLDVTPDAIRDTTRELSDPSRDSCIDVENGSFESSVTEGAVSVTA